jgi:hypothetical protein
MGSAPRLHVFELCGVELRSERTAPTIREPWTASGVSFGYVADEPILTDVDFTVAPASTWPCGSEGGS